jgi:hypothetical protein
MTAVPFDTRKLADKLQASGFTADQARGAATALAEAMSEGSASKDDSKDVRSDIQDVRTSIELAKRDLKIWFGSTLVVAVGILLAAIRYLGAPPHP